MSPSFKHLLKAEKPLAYFYELLNFKSSISKRLFLETEMMTDTDEICTALNEVEAVFSILEQTAVFLKITSKMQQINPIQTTLIQLQDNITLSDIECFEIKHFAFIAQALKEILESLNFTLLILPDLKPVISILDPEKTGTPTFWIYNAYHKDLEALRSANADVEIAHIEKEVLQDLTSKLLVYAAQIDEAYLKIAKLDILLAKAELAQTLKLSKPEITNVINFKGLFNPQIKEILREHHKTYQPVDFELTEAPTLITGANMSGKTLLLKNLMLAQYLLQFGFYVPAAQAQMRLFKSVFVQIGESVDELNGLSSFGNEILKLNDLILNIKSGEKPLVLIDEPARTTNPKEGEAIVNALAEFLNRLKITAVITTHYAVRNENLRKYRVKGFTEYPHIDYSIIEDCDAEPPQDALKIAELLGVDKEFLKTVIGIIHTYD